MKLRAFITAMMVALANVDVAAGGKATMTAFESDHRDFFLKPKNAAAQRAYADAIRFLTARLIR
ncbi:hypothetical protein [Rhizobium skierniewicense]|uniref:hypothetical protein n=1 Tax=Rhizobium skierniewicense TaxID=984260 RepID=UPI0015746E69|nr:hypothetical protein [Rhizobium skierniewicense]NTF32409.1 hypothetical protein [Rhizobium skierniewicense]